MLDDLPDSLMDQAKMLEAILTGACEGVDRDQETAYAELRSRLLGDGAIKPLLPDFVGRCRTLRQFWPYIKQVSPHWAPRRAHVAQGFNKLFDHLEGASAAPHDQMASEALEAFDPEHVAAVWKKALDRRYSDIDGAITTARTLLETVCKHVLDQSGIGYEEGDDLPRLYRAAAKLLNLAPDQHAEEIFKQILGGCVSVVQGLGSVRSKIGDAHGHGKGKARPAERHACLAVNLAGSMALFIVETFAERNGGLSK